MFSLYALTKCHIYCVRVFLDCLGYVDLELIKKNCDFDSCTNHKSACSALEQAAEDCKNAGICIDWRGLTKGACGMLLVVFWFKCLIVHMIL